MKKTVTLVSSIASLVLALVLALMLFLPVVTIDTAAIDFNDDFKNGVFTSMVEMPETCEVGFDFAINYLTYGADIVLQVRQVQENPQSVSIYRKKVHTLLMGI